jgi:hypothetical protein
MLFLVVGIFFLVVIVGSIVVGRWLQRKGQDLEKGGKDDPR